MRLAARVEMDFLKNSMPPTCGLFRVMHRRVGIVDERFGICRVQREDADPDRRR